jgi:hypothetical protein
MPWLCLDADKLDASATFEGSNLFHISLFDHLYKRGYVMNVPGALMCGCVEQMPIASRADSTQARLVQATTFAFKDGGGVDATHSGERENQFNACRWINGNNSKLVASYTRSYFNRKKLRR